MNSPESVASTGAATGATAGATGVDPAVGPERVPAGVTPVITDLYFYPVKSCRGVRMTEAVIEGEKMRQALQMARWLLAVKAGAAS